MFTARYGSYLDVIQVNSQAVSRRPFTAKARVRFYNAAAKR